MNSADAEEQKWGKITRRELNTGMVSGALTLLSSRVFGSTFATASEQSRIEIGSPSVRLVHERSWHIEDADKSTQVLGNGRAMVHELGPNIVYFRAPWISSPNLLTMTLTAPLNIRTISSREIGTTIWHHKLYVGSQPIGMIVDFLEDGEPCLRRVISSSVELAFSVKGPRFVDYSGRYEAHGALLGQWPYGTDIFGDFKSSDPFTIHLVFPKQSRIQIRDSIIQTAHQPRLAEHIPAHETLLYLPTGDSEIWIAAGSSVQDCFNMTDKALIKPARQSLLETRQCWRSRLAQVRRPGPERQTNVSVEGVIDDVATLVLGHQSHAGPICAGQIYPMFYVRDQYGVSRALLALNLTTEAKAVLAYYHQIWLSYGCIHNAQSDGPRHWFHKAENDHVELTGYLIIQAFDYLKATKDDAFITEIFPMLEWALNAQENQLFSAMLPFNGDETYVAGEIFPRTHLDDGSSEATLLYLAAVGHMLPWAATHKLWPADKMQRHRQTAAGVKQNYGRNFVVNNRLMVNHSRQPELSVLPQYRFGVCLGQYDKNCLFLSDTEIAEDGRYFCYSCYPQRTRKPYEAKNYFIPSVALTSCLVDYSAAQPDVMSATFSDALGVFTRNGRFEWPETILPGYETAVISLALSQRRDPRSAEFIERMLDLRDSTGAWVEYYIGTSPNGCRCRPWESSLSLLALLEYLGS
jgi:hypothetical protein